MVRAAEPRRRPAQTGIVDQVMAGYLRDRIADAAASGASAVVVRLDTPGGSLEATRSIVGTLLDAPLPVVVWVAPSGARAASAGTFITLSANLAYMAPGTNIGAASPVGGQGEDIEGTLGDKVKNDAIKLMESIADARGRDVDAAVETVKSAASYTAQEAIDKGLVDGFAADLPGLRAVIDGRTVTVRGLDDAGYGGRDERVWHEPVRGASSTCWPTRTSLHILFTTVSMGLFELANPNLVTGILGVFALILAFIGFGSLPLNLAGLLLVGLAIVLFVLELTVTSHGLLAIGGWSPRAGASALTPRRAPAPRPVATPLLAVMTVTTGSSCFSSRPR
jgi:membrane-bound serine protease (ClpP class)